ncbi:hypothetical protein VPH35_066997 [Triticum aestivum]
MSSLSSSSLPVLAEWLLPLIACPLCGDEVVTAVARTGNNAGHRFYKCIRYDCRFFEFQRAYCRRMTQDHIVAAQHQAGWHPVGHGFAVHHGNPPVQMVPAAIQPQAQQHAQPNLTPQIQAAMHQPPQAVNNLFAEAIMPAASAGAAYGAQGLAAVAVLMAVVNILLTIAILMVVLAMYFA